MGHLLIGSHGVMNTLIHISIVFFSNLFINVAFESYMKAKIVHEIHYSC